MDTGYMDCWITGLLIAYTACEREDVNRNIDCNLDI